MSYNVKFAVASSYSSFLVLDDYSTYGFGLSGNYQLGSSGNKTAPTLIRNLLAMTVPIQIETFDPVVMNSQVISGNNSSSSFYLNNGNVMAWGNNAYGQLGLGDRSNRSTPVTIVGLTGVKQLVSGGHHTLALMEDGTVKAWGYNGDGRLGLGDMTSRLVPTVVSGVTEVKQLVAGFDYSLALMEDGTVKAWGNSAKGQLGLGNTTNQMIPATVAGLTGVRQIITGSYHSLALMVDGTVKTWGKNDVGQLGLGTTTNRLAPTIVAGINRVKQITAGYSHTLVLMEDDMVKAWGNNNSGQLGLGNTTNQLKPVAIASLNGAKQLVSGFNHTFALMEDGTVKAWGQNSNSQLGLGDTTDRMAPVTVSDLNGVKQIVAGWKYSMTLMEDGTVKAWGANPDGQLGLGDTTARILPVTVAGLTGVKQLVTGINYSLVYLDDGTVKAWGSNTHGQLGIGNTTNRLTPVIVSSLKGVKQLVAGGYHALALMEDGTVKAWGANSNGELGLGNTTGSSIPVTVAGLVGVRKLVAGGYYTLAFMDDGTVKSWGNNDDGQLGLLDTTVRLSPVTVSGLSGVKQLVTGVSHTVALMEDGSVKAWGKNGSGQLGIGNTTNHSTAVIVANLAGVKHIAAGSHFTFALMEDSTIKAWGENYSGQLGFEGNQWTPTQVPAFTSRFILPKIRLIGPINTTVTAKYYVDAESTPREQQTVKLVDQIVSVTFNILDYQSLTEGSHTLKFVVSDGIQTTEKTITFHVYKDPISNGLTVKSEDSSITLNGSALGKASNLDTKPYRFTVGEVVSAWGTDSSYTVFDLSSNTKYAVKLEIKDKVGHISTTTQEVYTKAVAPTLVISNTTPRTATLLVNDMNPAETQYQITTGSKYVSQDGELVSQSDWITVPEKVITIGGITNGKSYPFRIKARNGEGIETDLSTIAQVGPPVAPPSVPGNIKAKTMATSVTLSWNPVADATGYEVEVNGGPEPIYNELQQMFVHNNLTPNTDYTYRIRAVKDDVLGEWSEPVEVRTNFAIPSTPATVNVVLTSMTATLNWSTVSNATGYELEWDGQIYKLDKRLTFKFIGLQPGSQHTYRVRATNAGGASEWSKLATVLTKTDLPDVPTGLIASATDSSVSLNWNENADAYTYEVEADGVTVETGGANFTELKGLPPGTSHQYRVRAVNEIGASEWSAPVSVSTHALATPSGVVDEATDQSITLRWNAVTGASSYQIEANGAVFSASTNEYTHTGLTPETTHTYRIRAMGAGDSAWSKPFTLSTLPTPPGTPTHLNAIASKNSVTLVWDAIPDATGYDVELDGRVVVDNFDATTYTDIELKPYERHLYRVRARNDAIEGAWSPVVVLHTLPDKPGIPTNIAVTSASSIVTLTWNQELAATGYEIEIDGTVVDVGSKTEYKHRRLITGSEHKYRIRTRNSAGVGEWSGTIINNTLTAKLTKNKTVDLGLVTKDIVDFSKYTLTVTYDANAMDVVNLSTLSEVPILTKGRIEGTDITITDFRPGKITFVCDKAVRPGESWSGVINSIKFKASVSGGSSITYSVITKPELTGVTQPE